MKTRHQGFIFNLDASYFTVRVPDTVSKDVLRKIWNYYRANKSVAYLTCSSAEIRHRAPHELNDVEYANMYCSGDRKQLYIVACCRECRVIQPRKRISQNKLIPRPACILPISSPRSLSVATITRKSG